MDGSHGGGCAAKLDPVNKSEPVVQYRCGLWLKGRGAGGACGHVLGQGYALSIAPFMAPLFEGGRDVSVLIVLEHAVQWVVASLGAGAAQGDPSLGQTPLQLSGSSEPSPVGPGYASLSLHLPGDVTACRSPAGCTGSAHKGFNGR